MGCSCLGPTIKIKSIISATNKSYPQDVEEKNAESKCLEVKIKSGNSNISSSCISFSDDAQEDDKKENKKNKENKENKKNEEDKENENDVNSNESEEDPNKPIIIIV